MLKVYLQLGCNLTMGLMVNSMHVGHIKWLMMRLRWSNLLVFLFQSSMAGLYCFIGMSVSQYKWELTPGIHKQIIQTQIVLEIENTVYQLMLFVVLSNHGNIFFTFRHDIIAQIYYAKRLAQRLYPVARMVDLHGGHLVSHERPEEVYFPSNMIYYILHDLS